MNQWKSFDGITAYFMTYIEGGNTYVSLASLLECNNLCAVIYSHRSRFSALGYSFCRVYWSIRRNLKVQGTVNVQMKFQYRIFGTVVVEIVRRLEAGK